MTEKDIIKELRKQLFESANEVYDRQQDETVPEMGETRKKVITLKDLNDLKKMRNAKREELAQQSVFVPYLYGPAENPEGEQGLGGGDLGGGLGL